MLEQNKPFFSILLPTRNNAEYLKGAIETVLNQNFNDYELIVSNNFSDDNTEDIILGFQSERIKYVKTDKLLYYDDSWNYALSYARGKYILLIGDDDGVMKNGLKKLKQEIIANNYPDLVSQPIVRYYIDSNNVGFNQIKYVEVKNCIEGFELSLKGVNVCITVLHIIFKREILKSEKLYSKPYPDYSAFLKIIYWSNSIFYSNIYVVIHGHTKKSAGKVFSLTDMKELRKVSNKQQGVRESVPLDLYFFSNGYYASMQMALRELSVRWEIDWYRYFRSYYGSLLNMKKNNDISGELKAFNKVLRKQSLKIRLKIKVYSFLKNIKKFSEGIIPKRAIGKNQTNVAADKFGINNILDVSQKLDDKLISDIKEELIRNEKNN